MLLLLTRLYERVGKRWNQGWGMIIFSLIARRARVIEFVERIHMFPRFLRAKGHLER